MSKKSRNAWIQLAILVLLGGAVILTLLLPQLTSQRTPEPPLELSVVIREADSSLWSNARLGMEQAAAELRAETRFLVLSKENDGQEQRELLRREYEGGADALVVVPADPEDLAQGWEKLAGKCSVVAMESELEGAADTIAPNNRSLGETLARALLEDWTGGGRCSCWTQHRTAPESGSGWKGPERSWNGPVCRYSAEWPGRAVCRRCWTV